MTPVVRGVDKMMIGTPKNGAPANDNPVACCVRIASELKGRGVFAWVYTTPLIGSHRWLWRGRRPMRPSGTTSEWRVPRRATEPFDKAALGVLEATTHRFYVDHGCAIDSFDGADPQPILGDLAHGDSMKT